MSADQLFGSFVDNILTPIYQLALGVAIAYFLYGVAMFIFRMNNEEARSTGKRHMLYGLIGLFIMFSIGWIISLFAKSLGSSFGF